MKSDAVLLALVLTACQHQPPASTGDTLRDLAVALDHVEAAHPYALASCELVRSPEDRRLCKGAVEALDEAALRGRRLLATVQVCREEDDEACVERALAEASELLLVLRPVPPSTPEAPHGR